MKKAKLIKRSEIEESKNTPTSTPQPAPQSILQSSMQSVLKWAEEKRRAEPVNARAKFAALFADLQTEP